MIQTFGKVLLFSLRQLDQNDNCQITSLIIWNVHSSERYRLGLSLDHCMVWNAQCFCFMDLCILQFSSVQGFQWIGDLILFCYLYILLLLLRDQVQCIIIYILYILLLLLHQVRCIIRNIVRDWATEVLLAYLLFFL